MSLDFGQACAGRRRRSNLLLGIAASAVAAAPVALAADWTNPAGGNWDDPANWAPSAVPGALDTANFDLSGAYTVALPATPVLVGGASVNKGEVGFTVGQGGSFQMYGLNVGNADAHLSGGGHFVIGDLDSIFNAGAFTVDRGSLLISGANTIVEAANDLELGTSAGNTFLTVSQSGVAELGRIRAATHPDANVWMTVRDNNNITLLRGKAAVIGAAGAATLSVTNEGRYNADGVAGLPALTIGAGDATARGRGFVLVDGNESIIRIKGQINVGDGGDGTLLISNAGRAAFSGTTRLETASIVGANGGNGQIRVTGTASSLRLNGAMIVNQNQDFSPVVVDDGGLIRADRLFLTDSTAGTGATVPIALVSGTGSTLSSPGKIDVRSGLVRIEDGAVVEAGIGMRIAADAGRRARVEYNGGTLRLGELTMAGGDLTLSAGADKIVRTGRVFFYSPQGQIDLADNAMMVDYFEFEASPLEGVRQAIGSRIVSSAVTADPDRFALGTAEGFDLPSAGGGVRSFFRESVDNTAVLVRFTYKGDATLDGAVGIDDFSLLAANFNQPGRWFNGDFTNDGQVNVADFAAMASNFGLALPAGGGTTARPGAVPEPASLGVLALAAAALAGRRRRQA